MAQRKANNRSVDLTHCEFNQRRILGSVSSFVIPKRQQCESNWHPVARCVLIRSLSRVPRVLSRRRARGVPRGGSLGVFLICWLPWRLPWAQRGREREGEDRQNPPERTRVAWRCRSRSRVAVGGLGNRTLCDFYRERANFAIELCRRQWQSARALDGFSAWHFQRGSRRAAIYVLQLSNYYILFVAIALSYALIAICYFSQRNEYQCFLTNAFPRRTRA